MCFSLTGDASYFEEVSDGHAFLGYCTMNVAPLYLQVSVLICSGINPDSHCFK